jgi:endonuclease III related protein
MDKRVQKIYKALYDAYGAQGWWPYIKSGYHPGEYGFHKSQAEIFEICLGVILTQNTTFASVVKSLQNLEKLDALSSEGIQKLSLDVLKKAIRPSGYFNQKAVYILEFIAFFENLQGRIPTRKELLHVKGIGEESADSILLYAYNKAEFVIDAYTKRLFIHAGLVGEKVKYGELKEFIVSQLHVKNERERVVLYQEFHALIVAHAKRHYSKKPYGVECFLGKIVSNKSE